MNLPLPSASNSGAPATTRYGPMAASTSRADVRDGGTDFAETLAGASLSAGSHILHHLAGANSPRPETDKQGPPTQAPNGSATDQAGAARRARLKTSKSDGADAAVQGNAGPVILNSLPLTDAAPLPAPGANSAFPVECGKNSTPDEAADSSLQQPTIPSGFQPMQWAPSGVLADSNGADPRPGELDVASATAVINKPKATAIGRLTVDDANLTPDSKLTSTAHPADPLDPAMPNEAAHQPAGSNIPEPSNINHDNSAAVPPVGSSAAVVGSTQNWVEKIAPPSMPPDSKETPRGTGALHDAASDAGLGIDSQHVRLSPPSVGIASAERSSEMRKRTDISVPVRLDRASGLEVSASTAVSPAFSGTPATAPAARPIANPAFAPISHAAAAVEATLDAVENMRDTAHSSVELKLSFGDDARLAVRVELRNGELQTTFRTDSTDLRQALTHEWHQQAPTVTAPASDRPVRIADPVFASESGSLESAGTSTGGHADSRQPSAPAPAESPFSNFPRSQAQASPASSSPSGPSRLPTSLRLNVFA